MFLVDNIEEYDPYAETVTIGGVQSNDLYEWIKNYNKSYTSGRLPIKDGKISADLFESDIDASRKMNNENGVIKMGYSYYDFDADVDLQTLQSWSDSDPSFWDNWLNFGLGAAFTGGPDEETKTVAPIQILKASDLTGTNTEIAERLLVNVSDVDSIKAEYNNATTVSGINDEERVVVPKFVNFTNLTNLSALYVTKLSKIFRTNNTYNPKYRRVSTKSRIIGGK